MQAPFTVEQFLSVFKNYNEAVAPMLPVLYASALVAFLLTIFRGRITDRVVSAILGFFWLWMGIVYHIIFFTAINKAAYLFGALFIVQGILFLVFGLILPRLSFRFSFNIYSVTGVVLITYALFIYPVLGMIFGHRYPSAPTFGLPCPTTIFTFGILLLLADKCPVWLLFIPLLWSLVGFGAALLFGIYEDTGLLAAGIISFALLMYRRRPLHGAHAYTRDPAIQDMRTEEI